ncbi:MAG: nuclear transport factor 2 family protein [Chromatocurvus sp.]
MPDTLTTEHLFKAIDARDSIRFAALLHPDAVFQFGNAPAVHGREAIREVVAGFFASIAAVEHGLVEAWQPPGALICHGTVTYTRHDGSTLTVPFANVLGLEAGVVRDYRIYVDISALYAEAG